MYDGREFPASIIGRDPSTDLAVIKIIGESFAIPSSHAEDIVANLIQYGYVRGRAVLGVTIQYGGGNVQIVSVGAGSTAHVAGVLPGALV